MTTSELVAPQQKVHNRQQEHSSSKRNGGEEWFGKKWFEEAMQPQNRGTMIGIALAAAAGYMLMQSSSHSRQISWQEFRINYLEKGEVCDGTCGTHKCTTLHLYRWTTWRSSTGMWSVYTCARTEEPWLVSGCHPCTVAHPSRNAGINTPYLQHWQCGLV